MDDWMAPVLVWLILVTAGGSLLLPASVRANGAAVPPPDAAMLLDLDLLKDIDLVRQRGVLRWLPLLGRLRLLEHLDLFEAAPPPGPARAEEKK
jgi:hypothetical protein